MDGMIRAAGAGGPAWLLLLLLVSLAPDARGQREFRSGRPGSEMGLQDERLFIEPVLLPTDSAGASRVGLLVRVQSDLLIFVRTGSAHPDSAYRGGLQFSLDILDRSGKPVLHRDKSVEVYVSRQIKEENRIADRLFALSFPLPPGVYRAQCIVTVDESQIEQRRMIPLRVREDEGGMPRLFAAVPLADTASGAMRALAFGGGVPYTRNAFLLVALRARDGAELSAGFPRGKVQPRILRKLTGAVAGPDPALSIGYIAAQAPDSAYRLWIVELPTDSLQFGMHQLTLVLREGDRTDTLRQPIPVIWEGRPRSLSSLAYAIAAMRYILTDDQFDAMREGEPCDNALRFIGGVIAVAGYLSSGDYIPPEQGEPCAEAEKFFSFWKKMDPTPGTVWNERMVEYFRRVDDARDAYRSVIENDGVFTPRGRIHILYGPPEETARTLSPDGAPLETWLYPSIGKKFVFIDRGRNGGYELQEEGTL